MSVAFIKKYGTYSEILAAGRIPDTANHFSDHLFFGFGFFFFAVVFGKAKDWNEEK